jgi:hypothetical protein
MPFETELEVEFIDGNRWLLLTDLIYRDGERVYLAPAGFKTDFASIPRPLWAWLPKAGPYAPAAVIHDWLYFHGRDFDGKPVTRGEADGAFKKAMADLGVPKVRRSLMWAAVRVAAGFKWREYRATNPTV